METEQPSKLTYADELLEIWSQIPLEPETLDILLEEIEDSDKYIEALCNRIQSEVPGHKDVEVIADSLEKAGLPNNLVLQVIEEIRLRDIELAKFLRFFNQHS